MLTFISSSSNKTVSSSSSSVFALVFLASSAMLATQVHAGSGAFAVKPRFAKDDITINQLKGFVGCQGKQDKSGRKTGEAFLSHQAMDKIREAVGLPHFAGAAATATGGANIQATLITKTTLMHSDHQWDSARTPMSPDERTGFVVLSHDHEAYFNHGGTMIPLVQGSLVTFEGSIEHNTIVKSGNVLLAGPFDLNSFENVGGPCSNDGIVIGDGSGETVTEDECTAAPPGTCTICYVDEVERRRHTQEQEPLGKKDSSSTTTTSTGGGSALLSWLNDAGGRLGDGKCEECASSVTRICSNKFTSGPTYADQPGFACRCGGPQGAPCTSDSECCSNECCDGVCLRNDEMCLP